MAVKDAVPVLVGEVLMMPPSSPALAWQGELRGVVLLVLMGPTGSGGTALADASTPLAFGDVPTIPEGPVRALLHGDAGELPPQTSFICGGTA